MKPSELVRKGWTQNALARDKNGNQVEPVGKSAVSFDLLGSLIAGTKDFDQYIDGVNRLSDIVSIGQEFRRDSLTEWNDVEGRTQEEVVNLLESVGL